MGHALARFSLNLSAEVPGFFLLWPFFILFFRPTTMAVFVVLWLDLVACSLLSLRFFFVCVWPADCGLSIGQSHERASPELCGNGKALRFGWSVRCMK